MQHSDRLALIAMLAMLDRNFDFEKMLLQSTDKSKANTIALLLCIKMLVSKGLAEWQADLDRLKKAEDTLREAMRLLADVREEGRTIIDIDGFLATQP